MPGDPRMSVFRPNHNLRSTGLKRDADRASSHHSDRQAADGSDDDDDAEWRIYPIGRTEKREGGSAGRKRNIKPIERKKSKLIGPFSVA